MAQLRIHVRHGDEAVPVDIPILATAMDLMEAARKALSLRGRVEYQGKRLEDAAATLADVGFSQQATVDFVPLTDDEKQELDNELSNAVKERDAGRVRRSLAGGARTLSDDPHGNTPLHSAAEKGYTDLAKAWIDFEVPVNAKNKRGETPLHLAAMNGKLGTVRFLCAQGSHIHVKDNDGRTPQYKAAYYGRMETVDFLMDIERKQKATKEAKRNAEGKRRSTSGARPVHLACSQAPPSARRH